MDKEKDWNYIKQFTTISVKKLCSELAIDYSNIMNKKASAKSINKVKEKLQSKVNELEK